MYIKNTYGFLENPEDILYTYINMIILIIRFSPHATVKPDAVFGGA